MEKREWPNRCDVYQALHPRAGFGVVQVPDGRRRDGIVDGGNMPEVTLFCGDCLDFLATLEDNSVDSVVTDPPAGIAFMGRQWDKDKGGRDSWIAWMSQVASECLRVLKPGAHALVWALPRTSHWTATAWENAGFELREKVYHCFGSGFPKSTDISKQLDKMAGAKREVVGNRIRLGDKQPYFDKQPYSSWDSSDINKLGEITAPSTDLAKQWEGWGTALKPSVEEWILLRKPLSEKNIATNVARWGTGAMNIDGCRVPTNGDEDTSHRQSAWSNHEKGLTFHGEPYRDRSGKIAPSGRWPAGLIHDGSEEVVAMFPRSKGNTHEGPIANPGTSWKNKSEIIYWTAYNDDGSAARYFQSCPLDDSDVETQRLIYCAKASRGERNEGLCGKKEDGKVFNGQSDTPAGCAPGSVEDKFSTRPQANTHPTVKPVSLLRYLCRLITPPGGVVLDPFIGSGSTAVAAILEGFDCWGCDNDTEYIEIAKARVEWAQAQPPLPGLGVEGQVVQKKLWEG